MSTDLLRRRMAMARQLDGDYPPPNEIWYTSDNILELSDTSCLGEVLYHKKRRGKYVVGFTNKEIAYANIFKEKGYLTSLLLPEGTTKSIMRGAINYVLSGKFEVPYSCTSVATQALGHFSILKTNGSIGTYNFSPSLQNLIVGRNTTDIQPQSYSPKYFIIVEDGCSKYDSRNNCNAVIETATNKLVLGCNNTIIPDSVTTIARSAFAYLDISEITIPTSVTKIEGTNYANTGTFNHCEKLDNVVLHDGITSLPSGVFEYCTGLKNIKLGNHITSIGGKYGSGTFQGCKSLLKIDLPATLKSLGINTFSGCTGLTEITCRAITPPTAQNTGQFTNVPTGIPVYVPAESVDAYKASDLWGIFTNIQAIQQ